VAFGRLLKYIHIARQCLSRKSAPTEGPNWCVAAIKDPKLTARHPRTGPFTDRLLSLRAFAALACVGKCGSEAMCPIGDTNRSIERHYPTMTIEQFAHCQ
jgi:hypothetical protein